MSKLTIKELLEKITQRKMRPSSLQPYYIVTEGDIDEELEPICAFAEFTEDGEITQVFHEAEMEANRELFCRAPALARSHERLVAALRRAKDYVAAGDEYKHGFIGANNVVNEAAAALAEAEKVSQ